jgi:hypothetical protein
VLDDGEVVHQLIQGSYLGKNAVAVVTDRRLMVVNDREWKADIRSVPITGALTVQGMGDERSAALTVSGDGDPLEITAIDPAHAREFAHRIRTRAAEA